jgi:hypothetical protein
MEHIAAYAAELVRDDWWQSAQLEQRPVLRRRTTLQREPPEKVPRGRSQAASDNLGPGATSRVGAVTQQTLKAIAFPEFVADLIRSTFRAVMDASIQQLDAIRALLGNVSNTVDDFEEENITDSQAREWLAQQYGSNLQLRNGVLSARPDAADAPPPPWQRQLGLPRGVDPTDEDALEEVLVPAARRKLSQGRLETLSLLVLMGLNRIVVTGGKIRATMAFHIDASDAATEANASQFDMRVAAAGSVGFGPWSASVSTSVGYVKTSKNESSSEINVAADLTGEVELHFKSESIQLDRLVGGDSIDRIVANTPQPSANAEAIPWGTSPEARVAPSPRRTSARIEAPLVAPPPLPAAPALPPATPAPTTPAPGAAAPSAGTPTSGRPSGAAPPAAAPPATAPAATAPAPSPTPTAGPAPTSAPTPAPSTAPAPAVPPTTPPGTAPPPSPTPTPTPSPTR